MYGNHAKRDLQTSHSILISDFWSKRNIKCLNISSQTYNVLIAHGKTASLWTQFVTNLTRCLHSFTHTPICEFKMQHRMCYHFSLENHIWLSTSTHNEGINIVPPCLSPYRHYVCDNIQHVLQSITFKTNSEIKSNWSPVKWNKNRYTMQSKAIGSNVELHTKRALCYCTKILHPETLSDSVCNNPTLI